MASISRRTPSPTRQRSVPSPTFDRRAHESRCENDICTEEVNCHVSLPRVTPTALLRLTSPTFDRRAHESSRKGADKRVQHEPFV